MSTVVGFHSLVVWQFLDVVDADAKVWLAAKNLLQTVDNVLLIGLDVGELLAEDDGHDAVTIACRRHAAVANRLHTREGRIVNYAAACASLCANMDVTTGFIHLRRRVLWITND